ncbi:hypothetical protein BCR42DRAFT_426508 [Absidia repens]|uniref:F-box domain-containing protein n=1 Tax=Absidia repens TaxID=90262 RepID=A0A1X2I1L7_9FUNG|nr:hypothetical protein BCR42DRAFT_426508 [Absidia repens]
MATEADKKDITEELQTSLSNNGMEEQVHLRIRKRVGGAPQINRYAHEILDHERSTVELKPGGAILITPHPRDLPGEIVSLILHHVGRYQPDLYSLSLVNKQFHAIINPLLWEAPTLLFEKAVHRFASGLADTRHETSPGRHVAKLIVIGEDWSDTDLSLLLPHVRHLKELTIHAHTNITEASFIHLPRHCRELTHVTIFETNAINEHTMVQLTQHCHHLQNLQLILCPRLPDHTFVALGNAVLWIIHAIRQWPRIKSLDVADIPSALVQELLSLPTNNNHNSHPLLEQQQQQDQPPLPWPHLQSLSVGNCSDMDNTRLLPFLQAHPHVSELRIQNCGIHLFTFDDESVSVETMAAALPCLTSLRLSHNYNVTASALRRLVVCCPQLTALTLYHCHRVTAADFPGVQEEIPDLIEMKSDTLERIRQTSDVR